MCVYEQGFPFILDFICLKANVPLVFVFICLALQIMNLFQDNINVVIILLYCVASTGK